MKKPSRGLSPSSFKLYQACQRKYFLEKIVEAPADPDAEDDTEALTVGKIFHKVLEDTRHELAGVTVGRVAETAKEFAMEDPDTAAMIWAMLYAYKRTHEASGLKVLECEKVVDTPDFYGIVDAVMASPQGEWWIVDMKTAASWNPDALIPTLPTDLQMTLYTQHAPIIAEFLGLDMRDFQGCRYRAAIKMRIMRKADESIGEYATRLAKVARCYDIEIPKRVIKAGIVAEEHYAARVNINQKIELAAACSPEIAASYFLKNRGNCMSYFRPCKYWSQCHGQTFTEAKTAIKVCGG
jgi:hypothetical protein